MKSLAKIIFSGKLSVELAGFKDLKRLIIIRLEIMIQFYSTRRIMHTSILTNIISQKKNSSLQQLEMPKDTRLKMFGTEMNTMTLIV